MSLRFIKLMASTKNTNVTTAIQTILKPSSNSELSPRKGSILPISSSRVRFTTWVKGKTPNATACNASGTNDNGKNVPLKRNIGVMNRKVGKLKKSISGATAVKHIAKAANSSPPKNAKTGTNKNSGLETKPKAAITPNTIVAFMVARVAPHRSSPAITSSTLTGVAIIASNVFWKYMRTNDAYVHSKKEPYITDMAIKPGPIN